MELSWWSRGLDSVFLLQRTWVQSLVGKLRSHMPCGEAKKKKEKTAQEKELIEKPSSLKTEPEARFK